MRLLCHKMNRNCYCLLFLTCTVLLIITITCVVFTESKKINTFQDVLRNDSNSFYIKNEQEFLRKINAMVEDTIQNLQIITDFDNTLTLDAGIQGKRVLNTFEMFRLCPSVPQSYKDEEYKLYQRYKNVETDTNLSLEEKSKLMVDWYTAAHNLMKGIKFPRRDLNELAQNMTDCFRTGIREVLSWSIKNNVPITILSSGLGDALTATLEAANLTSPNVKVIANFLDINNEEIIMGLKGGPIHSFNKNEASIKGTDFYDKIKDRKNVILMGDTIGDADMADGLDNLDKIIKIAFLSKKRENRLALYMENFDLVLFDDQTLNVLLTLLELIT